MESLLTFVDTGMVIGLVCGIVGGVLLLITIFFVLNKYVFAISRAKKALKQLEDKYEYLHALLTGQDTSYISRLDIISRTNLLYGDVHAEFFKRYKEIRDVNDVTIQRFIYELRGFLEEKKIKDFRAYYKENYLKFQKYEEMVNQLNDDLINKMKPEEECRQDALTLKDRFREVKSKYNANEFKLEFVSDSFQKVFTVIDKRFEDFEMLVENANYEEAQDLLPKISSILEDLNLMITALPNLIINVNEVLPQKLKDLDVRYRTMVAKEFPLGYLNVNGELSSMNEAIENSTKQILNLSIAGVKEKLDEVSNKINDLNAALDQEEKSKIEFDEKFETVSNKFLGLEKEIVKVTLNIPKFTKYYQIDEKHNADLQEIRTLSDKVSKDKRHLQTCLHSYEKTPYSILIQRTVDLDIGTQETQEKFNAFKAYQASLKKECEDAYNDIKSNYMKLAEYEAKVRDLLHDDIYANFEPSFTQSFDLIDEISSLLKNTPIDVNEVKKCHDNLNETVFTLYTQVDDLLKLKAQARENILLINKDRMKFSDVNDLLTQAEKQYNIGDFRRSYELTLTILEKLKIKAGRID